MQLNRAAIEAVYAAGGDVDEDGIEDAFELVAEVPEKVRYNCKGTMCNGYAGCLLCTSVGCVLLLGNLGCLLLALAHETQLEVQRIK